MKKTDMNLLARYRELNKLKANRTSPGKLYLAIFLAAFLLIGAYSVKLFIDNSLLKQDIRELQSYVESPNVIARMNEVATLQDNLKKLDEMSADLNSIDEVLGSIPRYNSGVLSILYTTRPVNVRFVSVSYTGSSVIVDFYGPRPSDPSNYVLRLQRTNYFKDVQYSGYSYDAGSNVYRATITCTLKGGN